MISVVIPVYNRPVELHSCLSDMLAQTHTDFEVIIVDNLSTDGTAETARTFCDRDSRFTCVVCHRRGVHHARNAGVAAARGEYIFFLDSDDGLAPDALAKMWAAASEHNCDIVVPNQLCTAPKRSYIREADANDRLCKGYDSIIFFKEKLQSYLTHCVFKLYRASLIKENGICFKKIALGEDLLFNMDVFPLAQTVYYISEPLYRYTVSRNGLTFSFDSDLTKVKVEIHEKLSAFLQRHGLLDVSYSMLLINDVFAMMVSEPSLFAIKRTLALPCIRQLFQRGVFWRLPPRKKAVWLCIRFKMARPLKRAALCWRRRIWGEV